jgi:hypothetical protein
VVDNEAHLRLNAFASVAAFYREPRNAYGCDASPCMATTSLTTRGFTGQEEMDSICAVNLNARIYDPSIGNFSARTMWFHSSILVEVTIATATRREDLNANGW